MTSERTIKIKKNPDHTYHEAVGQASTTKKHEGQREEPTN